MNKNYFSRVILSLILNTFISLGHEDDRDMDIEDTNLHTSFSSLPAEIIDYIFRYIPEEDLINVRLVEKKLSLIANKIIKFPKEGQLTLLDPRHIRQYGYQEEFRDIKDPLSLDLSQGIVRLTVLRGAESSDITASWLEAHSDYLRQATNLSELNLSNGNFSSKYRDHFLCGAGSRQRLGSECLSEILSALSNLKTLKLASCSLQAVDIRYIGESFKHLKELEVLDLLGNPIEDESLNYLVPELIRLTVLQQLSLSVSSISQAKSLTSYFRQASNLRSLTLWGVNFTNGKDLIDGLGVLPGLKELTLSVSSQSYIGYIALGNLKQSFARLTHLNRLNLYLMLPSNDEVSMADLTNNQLGHLHLPSNLNKLRYHVEGKPSVFLKLPPNIGYLPLRSLYLSPATSYNPQELGEALSNLSKLETLVLEKNESKEHSTDDFAINLFKSITALPSVKILTLALGMRDTALQELTYKVPLFSSLQKIDLSGEVYLSIGGIKHFIEHLKPLSTLKTLDLSQAIILGEKYYADYYIKADLGVKEEEEEENNPALVLNQLEEHIKLYSSASLKFYSWRRVEW
ncbi:hypothetical protein [Candidatus Odyssella acanthamoebae]|uniref:F-box domain-containing protein n=1 Tax=Candidatus Odyssella acanthamoebae TaxID=91604 RepID=A0A077AUY3_9PROT|nr:hypothetical protein [Candidatus Paracaedibacter acanthamoebae]AIK96231.1 hypothetical protein ID47_04955 [Candidatus Paracaedibacter acanthamoebae]